MRRFLFVLPAFWLLIGVVSGAERHALLVGVDEYDQSNFIRALSAAGADAEALGKTLGEVAKVKPEHLRILTSKSGIKPTNTNILFELEQLGENVKEGDTVFFFFSGHGIEIRGTTYLLPSNCDSRTEATLRLSSIPTSAIVSVLQSLKASNLILVFDMCRSDPLKSSRDADPRGDSMTETQIKELVMAPSTAEGTAASAQVGPKQIVTFFSCSPGQKSYEWSSKRRGYFSYYFEQALRGEGKTAPGDEIRVGDLQSYVMSKVGAAVKQNEKADQVPFIKLEGLNPVQFPLAWIKGSSSGPSSQPGSSGASGALFKLRQIRKEGQIFKYSYSADIEDERYPETSYTAQFTRTTKTVKPNGDFTVENGTVEMIMKSQGQTRKAGAQPPVLVTYNSLGRVLSMSLPKGADEWAVHRISNLESLYLPSQPLKIGSSWQVELPEEPGKSVAGRGSYSLEGLEKVGEVETYRITGFFEELEGDKPASMTITFWISVADGIVVKQEGTMMNSPLPKSMPQAKSKTVFKMMRQS